MIKQVNFMGLEGGGQPITTIINKVASNLQRTVQREIIIKNSNKIWSDDCPC
jgi:hypothetical protein